MKIHTLLATSILLGGCSVDPKALAGAGTGAAGLLSFYSTTANLDQQLIEDTIKQNAVLQYLSPQQTCLDNPGFERLTKTKKPTYRSARNIANEELEELQKSDKEYQFLLKYSKAFDAIVKETTDMQAAVDDLTSAGIALSTLAPGTAPYANVALLASKAFKAGTVLVQAYRLRDTARTYKPLLKKNMATLSVRLPAMDRTTTARINVWRACTEEKFREMRQLALRKDYPTSVVELETSYSAFQAQYRSFVVGAPQVGHLLEAIIKANDAIADTIDPATIRASVDNLVAAVNAANAVYVATGALPK